jgi:hypothetical protein
MEKFIEPNGDEFFKVNNEWFWIDIENSKVGPFPTKEAARENAYACFWLKGGDED